MRVSRAIAGLGGGLALALAIAPVSSPALTPKDLRHRKPVKVDPIQVAPSIGSFTPAAGDAKFGASYARGGLTGNSGFQFTPSATPGANRRVTVAVRARASTTEQAERTALSTGTGALNPYAYNLGVALGWKRFAVTSDYAKVDLGPMPGSRESADIAFSYAGKRWSTRLALAADRALAEPTGPRLLDNDRNVSVDLGGSYSINNRLDVTGGVRYKVDSDRLQTFDDNRRDSQAIYIGTAFKF
jgi:hypothetical protein